MLATCKWNVKNQYQWIKVDETNAFESLLKIIVKKIEIILPHRWQETYAGILEKMCGKCKNRKKIKSQRMSQVIYTYIHKHYYMINSIKQ